MEDAMILNKGSHERGFAHAHITATKVCIGHINFLCPIYFYVDVTMAASTTDVITSALYAHSSM